MSITGLASGDYPVPRRRSNSVIWVLLLAGIVAAIYEGSRASHERQEAQRLAGQLQQLQSERAEALERLAESAARRTPRLPAPPMRITGQPPGMSPETLPSTNLWARFKDKSPKLSADQVETYLKAYGRQAANLLAAYRTSGDAALLKEAMEKYPNDPQVAFEALFAKDLSPEQRRQWLSAFEQSAPDNPLANYLSARDYLNAGQADEAIQELVAASGKHQFQDYTLSRRQDDEEAYLAAGYSVAEAKVIASSQVELPQLAQLKQLGVQMADLANSYRNAGDDASAQVVLQMAVGLGQSYSAGDCAISHLVGLAIERIALNAMDPNSSYGDSGHTVRDVLDQLSQQKTEISTLFDKNESLLETLSDQDWISYIDRDKSFGEEAALRWAVSKYGQR